MLLCVRDDVHIKLFRVIHSTSRMRDSNTPHEKAIRYHEDDIRTFQHASVSPAGVETRPTTKTFGKTYEILLACASSVADRYLRHWNRICTHKQCVCWNQTNQTKQKKSTQKKEKKIASLFQPFNLTFCCVYLLA
jgi:hypothetical protein